MNPVRRSLQSAPWWMIATLLLGTFSVLLRFAHLDSPLLEPHPWRQTQTALTTYHLFHKTVNFFFYESPLNGKLWSFVYEFPLYQGLSVCLMKIGLSLEAASRLVSIFSFFTGAFFLYQATLTLFAITAARWTLLFYLISPFNIVFSRTALIDNFVQALMLGSWYFFIKHLRNPRSKDWAWLILLSSLGAITKITLWICPWILMGVWLCVQALQDRKTSKRYPILLMLSLFLPLLSYVLWDRWTHSQHPETIFSANKDWIVGTLSQRFELWRWTKIAHWVVRSVLADWMAIPVLVCLLNLRHWGLYKLGILFLLIAPILLFFNVYTFHDYYLICQAPYLALLAGMGCAEWHNLRPILKRTLAIMLLALLANHIRIARFYYEPIFHDYREHLALENTLRELTHPEDLIYAHITENPWQLPLYSQRLVATGFSERWIRTGDLRPSLFYFPKGKEDFSLLRDANMGVLQKAPYTFYRMHSPNRPLNPESIIFVGDTFDSPRRPISIILSENSSFPINRCFSKDTPEFYELSKERSSQGLLLLTDAEGSSLLLPQRRFLSIPDSANKKCRYTLTWSRRHEP